MDKRYFIIDISKRPPKSKINLVGRIISKKKFQSSHAGIKISDVTGDVMVIIDLNIITNDLYSELNKGDVIMVSGQVGINSKGIRIIRDIKNIEICRDQQSNKIGSQINTDYLSKIIVPRICNKIVKFLEKNSFTEIETNFLSRGIKEDSLEPLLVKYPGFGSYAYLMPSPAPQLLQFLIDLVHTSVFSVSKSFSSSYRFPNGAAELRVVVSKSIVYSEIGYLDFIKSFISTVCSDFLESEVSIKIINEKWPIDKGKSSQVSKNEIRIIVCDASIPVIGEFWDTKITKVYHIVDANDVLLAECTLEVLGEGRIISSMTVYPSQFLALIEHDPARQLLNLMRIYE